MTPKGTLVSITAPLLNEEDTLPLFYERLVGALEGVNFELVLVNDGSTDRTRELLDDLASADSRVRVVHLSRNFGYQAAVMAGVDHCRGDAVITIDGDLQDPPEVIPKLIAEWENGAQVVYAARTVRMGESRLKTLTASAFSRIFARLSDLDIPANVGDFRLLDRQAVDSIKSIPERSRFMRGLVVWVGYKQSTIDYEREERFSGKTRYKWRTLIRISFDAIASFSRMPLQIATIVGFLSSILAFVGIPWAIISRLMGYYVDGVTTLMIVVLLMGGIQLITLGIIGEYISRIYNETKRRPLYVVGSMKNMDAVDIE